MTYNKKHSFILGAILFLLGLLAGGRILAPKIFSDKLGGTEIYLVKSVIDGDTFRIDDNIRIRLMGIDSPEKGECYYNEARIALTDLIDKRKVKLEKDITDKDRYDRWLRYAVLLVEDGDNVLVNDYLVRQGYAIATAIPPDKYYRALLSSAQEEARRKERGLWGECDYEERIDTSKQEKDLGPSDPQCIIKGNISEKGFGMTYLVPGCDNYDRVKIDIRKGEKYFCTEKEAEDAGFRKATNCP